MSLGLTLRLGSIKPAFACIPTHVAIRLLFMDQACIGVALVTGSV